MARMVYILGGLLILAGVIALVSGAPNVRVEQGWTEVIAGSVAGSAGCVIVVLGAIVARLEALQLALTGVSLDVPEHGVPTAAFDERSADRAMQHPTPVAPVEPAPAVGLAAEPELPLSIDAMPLEPPRRDPEVLHTDEPGSDELPPAHGTLEPAASMLPPAASALASRVPNFMSHPLVRRIWQPQDAKVPAPSSPVAEPSLMPFEVEPSTVVRTSVDLSSGWDREPEPAEAAAPPPVEIEHPEPLQVADVHTNDAAPPDLPAPHPYRNVIEQEEEPELQPELDIEAAQERAPAQDYVDRAPPPPTVVGRYTAGSASYVMYSNGMIEVETETGVHQFASMQELKTFIEQQDKAQV